ARDAMPAGGKIVIETADAVLDAVYALSHPYVKPGEHVMLAVADTGIGISEAMRERIFEPFFTTKELDRGTGLGLSTVYGIIKQHDGHIHVYSEPGKGTAFKVYLPAIRREVSPPDEARPALVGGTETVLVVDDDTKVRNVLVTMLESLGYRVLAANGAAELLDLSISSRESIDVLLIDIVMPEINGKELADTFKARHPETAVIFMSGYPGQAIARYGVLDPAVIFLQKPVMLNNLAQKTREALDRRNLKEK
ncbi:MAG TPA: ATP-binding protein, partial [Dissulfurispiraceae bacterium]